MTDVSSVASSPDSAVKFDPAPAASAKTESLTSAVAAIKDAVGEGKLDVGDGKLEVKAVTGGLSSRTRTGILRDILNARAHILSAQTSPWLRKHSEPLTSSSLVLLCPSPFDAAVLEFVVRAAPLPAGAAPEAFAQFRSSRNEKVLVAYFQVCRCAAATSLTRS
jgi:hypothetical protein